MRRTAILTTFLSTMLLLAKGSVVVPSDVEARDESPVKGFEFEGIRILNLTGVRSSCPAGTVKTTYNEGKATTSLAQFVAGQEGGHRHLSLLSGGGIPSIQNIRTLSSVVTVSWDDIEERFGSGVEMWLKSSLVFHFNGETYRLAVSYRATFSQIENPKDGPYSRSLSLAAPFSVSASEPVRGTMELTITAGLTGNNGGNGSFRIKTLKTAFAPGPKDVCKSA